MVPTGKNETSLRAAGAVSKSGRARSLERRVFDFIEKEKGATDEEGQRALGLSGDSYRPRRYSLVKRGLVEPTGTTRATTSGKQAQVWQVTGPWRKE